jgi:hypothetical protein
LQSQEENEPFRKLNTYGVEESEQMFERMYYQEKVTGDEEGEGEVATGNTSALAAMDI